MVTSETNEALFVQLAVVAVGSGVAVGEGARVTVHVAVAVGEAVAVAVGAGVCVAVAVAVGDGVCVGVALAVAVGFAVKVGVEVAVEDGVGVRVLVGPGWSIYSDVPAHKTATIAVRKSQMERIAALAARVFVFFTVAPESDLALGNRSEFREHHQYSANQRFFKAHSFR